MQTFVDRLWSVYGAMKRRVWLLRGWRVVWLESWSPRWLNDQDVRLTLILAGEWFATEQDFDTFNKNMRRIITSVPGWEQVPNEEN